MNNTKLNDFEKKTKGNIADEYMEGRLSSPHFDIFHSSYVACDYGKKENGIYRESSNNVVLRRAEQYLKITFNSRRKVMWHYTLQRKQVLRNVFV